MPAIPRPSLPLALAAWPLGGLVLLAGAMELSLPSGGGAAPSILTAAGRFCGLAGTGLWVASLLLMLRPATLERACGGLDQVYGLHHVLGVLCYGALLAHPLFLAAAQGQGGAALLLTATPAMLAGWVALLLLMGVLAATFWLPLPYALWRRLHALTAPAFVLGVLHGLLLAPAPRWAHGGFMMLALATGLTALGYRYLLHTGRVRTREYRVAAVRHPAPDVTEMILAPVADPLHWRPGQFVFAAFADGRHFKGCGEFHPYTIASADHHDGRLTLAIKSLGDCTGNIQSMEAGVPVRLQGPYGGFLASLDLTRPQLWVAGGIGITPFLAAAEQVGPAAPGVDLVHLYRQAPSPCAGRLARIQRGRANLTVHELSGESSPDTLWPWLRERVRRREHCQVFLCGPPGMVDGLRVRLLQAGVPHGDVHSERFDFR